MGLGVTLSRVRILAPQLPSGVTLGKSSHLPGRPHPEDHREQLHLCGDQVEQPKRIPRLLQSPAKWRSPGNPGGIISRFRAQAGAGLPEVPKKLCQATSLPSAKAAHSAPGVRSPVSSVPCANQQAGRSPPHSLRACFSSRADLNTATACPLGASSIGHEPCSPDFWNPT